MSEPDAVDTTVRNAVADTARARAFYGAASRRSGSCGSCYTRSRSHPRIEQYRVPSATGCGATTSEAPGDMPVPNCRTCISGPGGRTFTEKAGGSEKAYLPEPAYFREAGSIGSTWRKGGGGLPILST